MTPSRDPYEREAERFEKRPFWTVQRWIGIILAVVLIWSVIGSIANGGISILNFKIRGEVAEKSNPSREKSILFEPNNSIGTYEHFYDQCQAVKAFSAKITLAEQELKDRESSYDKEADPFGEERKAINDLRATIRALRNQQLDIAAQYNADASKTTQAQFRAADLPHQLEPPYEQLNCGSPKEPGR